MTKDRQDNTVAVVIPTFRREKTLCDTIESVLRLDPQPHEIYVIDQTPEHEPATETCLMQAVERGVQVVRLPQPAVCFARNLGAALCHSDIIIYLDDDVAIERKDFVEAHRRNYAAAEIQAVWGQILAPDRAVTGRCGDLAQVPQNYAFRVNGIRHLVGANHSIRRRVLLEMGGYDESFEGRTFANEDGDLGFRLYEQGYRIDFDPAASLIHLRAPAGGNRITVRDAFPEWTRSVTFFQFALRHYSGWARIWHILQVFRRIALRRQNLSAPWRLPGAVGHAVCGFWRAWQRHRRGFRSSLLSPGVAYLRQHYAAEAKGRHAWTLSVS